MEFLTPFLAAFIFFSFSRSIPSKLMVCLEMRYVVIDVWFISAKSEIHRAEWKHGLFLLELQPPILALWLSVCVEMIENDLKDLSFLGCFRIFLKKNRSPAELSKADKMPVRLGIWFVSLSICYYTVFALLMLFFSQSTVTRQEKLFYLGFAVKRSKALVFSCFHQLSKS